MTGNILKTTQIKNTIRQTTVQGNVVEEVVRQDILGIPGPEGPQGPVGPAGGEAFVFTQSTPATVWTIDHNLGFFPNVYVLDTAGDECEGNVDNVSVNRVLITFSAAFAGQARLI